jgi:hypothetical protein
MINEANASSSACRLWRVHMVETSAPPHFYIIVECAAPVKSRIILSNSKVVRILNTPGAGAARRTAVSVAVLSRDDIGVEDGIEAVNRWWFASE